MSKHHLIFDTEIIGLKQPHFLVKCKVHETGEMMTFWHHKKGHTLALEDLVTRGEYTLVGFNSENFDRPLLAAAFMGHDEHDLKMIAQAIIADQMRSWQTYREFNLDFFEYDHIDIMEVPPGVMLGLKTYEGRMHAQHLQDMPFDHTHDLTKPSEFKLVENYCENDVNETERLFQTLHKELKLRRELGEVYGIDLRSKSDAQCAEAILKKVCNIGSQDKTVPSYVEFRCPQFIQTDCEKINKLIDQLEDHCFTINRGNGSPEFPDFLAEPFTLNEGVYQFGIGGLHSKHDVRYHVNSSDNLMISDVDAASYYPNIIMKAGLIPQLGGGKGEKFLKVYKQIYEDRIAAKRAGDKPRANTLKIVLNGTYGKLGNIYCSFYAPELMLAVCLIGQLNLLSMIWELEKIRGVKVGSANTDGIMVVYPPSKRKAVVKVVRENAKRTGFEYEETPYKTVAMRDVNSYICVTEERESFIMPPNGRVQLLPPAASVAKRKGAYAKAGVMENVNPTFQICADACAQYLMHGTSVEQTINECDDIRQFISIRNVKGGGVQHKRYITVDDWTLIEDHGSAKNVWLSPVTGKKIKRKSKPDPQEVGEGGTPFGRVARWYMTTKQLPAITYISSGNTVAGTTGGMLCMELPGTLPKDLDKQWYINKAYEMLADTGVVMK